MLSKLRPYQIEDIEFLSNLMTAGCFNEQRTGKTPTALKTLSICGCKKILVICPGSALFQWKEEYERWLNEDCVAVVGTPKQRELIIKSWKHGLIISYDTLKETKTSSGASDMILAQHPDAVILDEAHRIKNPKAAATRAAFSCISIPKRLALTGTPASGKPEEVYCILAWLYPDLFKSYWKFIEEYFTKKLIQRPGQRPYVDIGTFKVGKAEELQTFLNNISTQRKRKEVMPWLPEKDYQQVRLPITAQQKKYLYELDHYFETEHVITQGVLDRLIRYRQICLAPELLNLRGNSPKIDWIRQYVTDYPEKSILIFSKFTSFLKLLQEALIKEKIGVIIGETPIKERNNIKQAFQNSKIKVLLLNIDAGKEALTLDQAETAIFTDKYPPIGDIQQAEDRFIATTESRASKSHTIIELMMKDTYDENIYDLLRHRKSETDIINDYQNCTPKKLKATAFK